MPTGAIRMRIDGHQRGIRALWLLAALVVLGPARVEAENPCLASLRGAGPGGIGGTGHANGPGLELTTSGDPENGGIGGTGLQQEGGIGGSGFSTGDGEPSAAVGGEEEGGVGGTGLGGDEATGGIGGTAWIDASSGIGGTGIYGTITAFGSLCVNGYHVDFDPEMAVEIDGVERPAKELGLGQVIEARVDPGQGSRLELRSLKARSAIIGPVGAIDAERGSLEVAGQRVAVSAGFAHENAGALRRVATGNFVAISGLRRNDGVVVASRVEVQSGRSEVSVEGPLRRGPDDALYIADLRVEAEAGSGARPEGEIVRARGRLDASTGTLLRARVEGVRRFASDVRRVSLEGYVDVRADGQARIGSRVLDLADLPEGRDAPRSGTRVFVRGRLSERGVIQVERLRLDRRPLDAPDRSERPDRPDRPERPDRPDRPDRPERSGGGGSGPG